MIISSEDVRRFKVLAERPPIEIKKLSPANVQVLEFLNTIQATSQTLNSLAPKRRETTKTEKPIESADSKKTMFFHVLRMTSRTCVMIEYPRQESNLWPAL